MDDYDRGWAAYELGDACYTDEESEDWRDGWTDAQIYFRDFSNYTEE